MVSHKPSLMAVKSSPLSNSRSLFVEKVFLQHFGSCPNIIHCYGDDLTFENGENIYNIFLEYAAGGSLADRIKTAGNSLPEDEVRRHTTSGLMGLSYIHKRGYSHCDIKPQNVLLVMEEKTGEGTMDVTAKIADFGTMVNARKRQEKKEGENVCNLRGTAMYMAPESISRNEYGHGVDIWALGCTVLEMLTGKTPWRYDPVGGSVPILFKLGCTEQVPEIPPELSILARDFLKRCLVRDTSLRWTADMLLNHPFITGEIDEDDAIKPYLIMSDSLLSVGKRLQSHKINCGKRKRTGHDGDEWKLDEVGGHHVASSYTRFEIFN